MYDGLFSVICLLSVLMVVTHEVRLPICLLCTGMYSVSAKVNDVAVDEVPLSREFQFDPAEVLAAATPATKIIFVCSPNNPTVGAVRYGVAEPASAALIACVMNIFICRLTTLTELG